MLNGKARERERSEKVEHNFSPEIDFPNSVSTFEVAKANSSYRTLLELNVIKDRWKIFIISVCALQQ